MFEPQDLKYVFNLELDSEGGGFTGGDYFIVDLFSEVLQGCRRHGGLVVGVSDFRLDGWKRVIGSRPGWSLHCCVVSLDKKLCSTLSLFTQVYK